MSRHLLYFAYGENMNVTRLKKWMSQRGGRPDGIVSAQRAVLRGYRLVFNVRREVPWKAGVANLEKADDGAVEGVLMEIDNAAEGLIQQREGIPGFAKRISVSVVGDKEKVHDRVAAFVAVRPDTDRSHPPARAYLEILLRAAQDFEFSPAYAEFLRGISTAD